MRSSPILSRSSTLALGKMIETIYQQGMASGCCFSSLGFQRLRLDWIIRLKTSNSYRNMVTRSKVYLGFASYRWTLTSFGRLQNQRLGGDWKEALTGIRLKGIRRRLQFLSFFDAWTRVNLCHSRFLEITTLGEKEIKRCCRRNVLRFFIILSTHFFILDYSAVYSDQIDHKVPVFPISRPWKCWL